jgi:hypothetical protein
VAVLAVLCPRQVPVAHAADIGRGRPSENACVVPSGRDLNQVFGVRDQIVGRFCLEVDAGERWRPFAPGWVTALDHAVIPPGYVPARPTPIEDFAAKFVAARYVIDPGTRHQRVHTFPAAQLLKDLVVLPADEGAELAWLPPIGFQPLPVGEHAVVIYITLSAEHWDGLGTDPASNRLPKGETLWVERAFTVVARGRP